MTLNDVTSSKTYRLGEADARDLWNWVLGRQGVGTAAKLSSAVDVARATLGLHAARLGTPFATVLARTLNGEGAQELLLPNIRESLVTVRCMRRTLHSLPLDTVAVAHSATRAFRERDALRLADKAGLRARPLEDLVESLCALLQKEGTLSPRDLEQRLVTRRRDALAVRAALKVAWERGVLTYQNASAHWDKELRRFGLSATLYPTINMSLDARVATRALLDAYFDRYGPATVSDAAWWSGLSRTAITAELETSDRALVEIYTPWTPLPMYMYRDRYEEYLRLDRTKVRTGLAFLAHEDVALKAYFDSRRRYLGEVPSSNVFNLIGEAWPTIMLDGNTIGTWKWSNDTSEIRARAFPGQTAATLELVRSDARRFSRMLRQGRYPRLSGL